MIKLKNIKIDDKLAVCDIIPEDSTEKGFIEVNLETQEVINFSLPKGYEWCKNHISHAVNALIQMAVSGNVQDSVIMWH